MKKSMFKAFYIVTLLFALSTLPSPVIAQSEAQAIDNQIVVNFKSPYSPSDLEHAISTEKSMKSTLFGSVQVFFTDMVDHIAKKPKPEEHLLAIEDVERRANVIATHRMFDSTGESQDNTYIYILDGSVSVDKAVTLFEELAEVAYAQPHYLYETDTTE